MSSPFQHVVDWNDNGLFDHPNADITEDLQGTFLWTNGKDSLKQTGPPRAGEYGAEVKNLDRLYSIWNTSGALSGLLKPGHLLRIKTAGSEGEPFEFMDGTSFEFMDGSTFETMGLPGRTVGTYILDNLGQNLERNNLSASLPALSKLSSLRKVMVSTGLYENILISEAIDILATKANWPLLGRNIAPSQGRLTSWCLDERDALEAFIELVNSEGVGATGTDDEEGNLVFEDREYRTRETRCTVSQAVFPDTTWHVQGLNADANFKDVIQACTLPVEEREAQALDVIWKLGADLVLAPNQTRTFKIKGPDWFKNAVVPSLVGTNAKQFIKSDQPLTSGTGKLGFKGVLTADIAHNASASTVQGELESLSTIGAGNVRVTGVSFTDGFLVEFINALGNQPVELLAGQSSFNPAIVPSSIDVSGVDPVVEATQVITPHATPQVSGGFKLRWGANTTAVINYNDPASTIQTKIRAIGPGVFPGTAVTVSGSGDISTNPQSIAIDEAQLIGGLFPFQVVEADSLRASGQPSATLNITDRAKGSGPDIKITAGGLASVNPLILSQTSGASTEFTIAAGASGLTAMGLQLRAQLFPVVRREQVTYPEGSTLPAITPPNVSPYLSRADAFLHCTRMVQRYNAARATGTLRVEAEIDDMATIDDLLMRKVSDRITIQNAHSGLNMDVHINTRRFEVTPDLMFVAYFGWEEAA
jgi:hypothetical protein